MTPCKFGTLPNSAVRSHGEKPDLSSSLPELFRDKIFSISTETFDPFPRVSLFSMIEFTAASRRD